MNMPSKKVLIPMAAVAIAAAGVYGVAKVSAASDPANPQASLVQKISDTFHLDKTKVQAVFDEHKQEMQATHEQRYEDMLNQAVKDGKITSAQKDAILAKHKELVAAMQANKDKFKDMTPTERKAALDKQRTELEAWAKANNVDVKYLMGFGMRGGHGMMGVRGGLGGPGMMGGHMHHDMDGDGDEGATPSTSPSPSPAS